MPWYIKTEKFTDEALRLLPKARKAFIKEHIYWVNEAKASGLEITSGYLIDNQGKPGAGGLLILKTSSFEKAQEIIKNDPMIISGMDKWSLHEWVQVSSKVID